MKIATTLLTLIEFLERYVLYELAVSTVHFEQQRRLVFIPIEEMTVDYLTNSY